MKSEYPFDKWQRERCGVCQVMQPPKCEQIKENFKEYQKGNIDIKRSDCPWREDP